MSKEQSAIKVAVELSKGIVVNAKGRPAELVAYGAAAGVVFVAAVVGVGGYQGGKAIYKGVRGIVESRREKAKADERITLSGRKETGKANG